MAAGGICLYIVMRHESDELALASEMPKEQVECEESSIQNKPNSENRKL
jgi:hypothetical protein